MDLTNLVERKLYLLVAIILLIFSFTIDFDSLGFSKTVGMAYEYNGIAKSVCLTSLLLSFVGYSILAILKYPTKKFLSLMYLSDIIPAVILSYTNFGGDVATFFACMSILVSFANIISSARVKNK